MNICSGIELRKRIFDAALAVLSRHGYTKADIGLSIAINKDIIVSSKVLNELLLIGLFRRDDQSTVKGNQGRRLMCKGLFQWFYC